MRSFNIYVDSKYIMSVYKNRKKLLHYLGCPQLQAIVYSTRGALIPYDEKVRNDIFSPLVNELNEYFSALRNSVFETHLFR